MPRTGLLKSLDDTVPTPRVPVRQVYVECSGPTERPNGGMETEGKRLANVLPA